MIAVVPVDGAIHVYTPGTLPAFSVSRPVRVDLGREQDKVGTVTFSIIDDEVNEQAMRLTYLLSGAYISVRGDALFEVADETLLSQAVAEVLVGPKEQEQP